jgi:hypothetical protein
MNQLHDGLAGSEDCTTRFPLTPEIDALRPWLFAARLTIAFLLFLSVLGISLPQGSSARRTPVTTESAAVLVGAGDIADCTNLSGAEATAKLLEKIPGTVMAVGDLAYPDGPVANFSC